MRNFWIAISVLFTFLMALALSELLKEDNKKEIKDEESKNQDKTNI